LALLLAAVFFWRTGGLSAVPAMAANALALTLACVLGVRWLFRAVPAPARSAVPAGAMREWLSIALPLLAMSFLRLLLSQSDILLIGWLLDQHSAGLYAVASRLAELASFGLQAANTTLAPTFSELHATGQTARLQEIVTRSARGIFAFTLVVSLGLGAGGEFVLGLFGPEFGAALPPLLILLAGQTVNAMTGSVGYLMTMTGHQRPAAWLLGLAAALTVGLNLLLIPRLGIGGAAIASATGMGALNLSMLVFVGSRLKINSTAFARIRYGQA
jgi:O-antigen/teichoic acid export membrane protein